MTLLSHRNYIIFTNSEKFTTPSSIFFLRNIEFVYKVRLLQDNCALVKLTLSHLYRCDNDQSIVLIEVAATDTA